MNDRSKEEKEFIRKGWEQILEDNSGFGEKAKATARKYLGDEE